jgi:hypothetical protein
MSSTVELLARAVAIGVGATLVMDLWALLLRQLGVPSLDFAMLGRWLGHLGDGQLVHDSIARAAPVRGERVLGWVAHYSIGVSFAGLALVVFGIDWARSPDLGRALLVGVVTVAAPLLILQPALGAGVASSKTATPLLNTLKSIATHTVFGFGLYAAARVTALLAVAR